MFSLLTIWSNICWQKYASFSHCHCCYIPVHCFTIQPRPTLLQPGRLFWPGCGGSKDQDGCLSFSLQPHYHGFRRRYSWWTVGLKSVNRSGNSTCTWPIIQQSGWLSPMLGLTIIGRSCTILGRADRKSGPHAEDTVAALNRPSSGLSTMTAKRSTPETTLLARSDP